MSKELELAIWLAPGINFRSQTADGGVVNRIKIIMWRKRI